MTGRTGRWPAGQPVLERLHQEDFCQAQGIVSEMKYQKEGGPSLKQCFSLLREVSSAPVVDLARFLDAVIYNYLVGNNDAHGKNFSLLYHGVGTDEPGDQAGAALRHRQHGLLPGTEQRHGDEDRRRISRRRRSCRRTSSSWRKRRASANRS